LDAISGTDAAMSRLVIAMRYHRADRAGSEAAGYWAFAAGGPRVKADARLLITYCLAAGGLDSGGGAGSAGSAAGAAPRSSGAAAQSPAQSLVPLTVPTSLQPIGAGGFTCFRGLPPTLVAV
jgi:hypothetical protein